MSLISKHIFARRVLPLLSMAASACSSSNPATDPTPAATSPDSGSAVADSVPPAPEMGPCAKALNLPSERTALGAGRQLRIPLSAAALAFAPDVAQQEDPVDAWIDNGTLVVRAGYASGEVAMIVQCNNGEGLPLPLSIKAPAWSLLSKWDGLADVPTAPPSREYFSFWQDQGDANRLFMLGGFQYQPKQFTPSNDLWAFNVSAKTWSLVAPTGTLPAHGGARLVSSPTERAAYLMGGIQDDASGNTTVVPMAKKLSYDGASFTIADAPKSTAAPESYTGSLVYDAKRARYLSVCGTTNLGPKCNIHTYTEAAGFVALPVAAGTAPKSRTGFHYAMDAANDRVVLFGGTVSSGNPPLIGDTWALQLGESPARWVKLSDEVPESAKRRNGGYVHDAEANRLFVWGGTPDGATSVAGIQVLDLTAGHERWFSFSPASHPDDRTSAMMLHDATGKRLIAGMGNNRRGVYGDLWELSLP